MLEDAGTGERLSARTGEVADFFHSRLRFSPGGGHLLSAGWVWHPWDALAVYDVAAVLADPTLLNTLPEVATTDFPHVMRSADFLSEDQVIVALDLRQ